MSDDDDAHHSRLSGISGTTAKTSFTQEEAERLEPKEILEDLPDLAGASEKLIRFLLPRGSQTPRSSLKSIDSKRYDKLITAVMVHKPSFGTLQYISPQALLRALFDEPGADQLPKSLESIIYRVNLVEMMNEVLVKCPPDNLAASYDALQILDRAFPNSIAGGQCQPQALNLWCAIATQMTIARLEVNSLRAAEFLPLQAIRDSFYDEDGNFKHTETLGVSAMGDAERGSALEKVANVCNVLAAPFQGGSGTGNELEAGILDLKNQFKWEQLLDAALAYFDVRKAQLDQQIDVAGDVAAIVEAIEAELQRRSDLKRSDQLREDIISTQNKPKKSFMNAAAMAILRQKEAALQQQQQQAAPVANMLGGPTSSSDAVPRASSGTLPKGAKKRSLLDRQEGAQLISFSQTQDELTQHTGRGQSSDQAVLLSSQSGEKRHAYFEDEEENGFDPTPDQGFIDAARLIAAEKKRRRLDAPESSASGPPYSSMYSNSGDAIAPPESPEPDHHHHESAASTSIYPPPASAAAANPIYGREYIAEALLAASQMPRRNPGSSLPIPTDPETSVAGEPITSMYARSNLIAKQNRAAMPKKVQVRRPWQPEEENALLDLIASHCADGISWSALKAIDMGRGDEAHLSARSAEDMRFKARNMRVTMML
jgi:hypothetical protein